MGGFDSNPAVVVGDYQKIFQSTFDTPDQFTQGLAVFDMSKLKLVDSYTAGDPVQYELNDTVKEIYAGSNQYAPQQSASIQSGKSLYYTEPGPAT